ncbi:MAG: hypothetical protein KDB03_28920, partial [Planctomycetales bacterium]|nr:hypothetical protein [Planctomycetales bacterium]
MHQAAHTGFLARRVVAVFVVDCFGFESEVFRCAAVGLFVCFAVNLVGRFDNDLALLGDFETPDDLPVFFSVRHVVTEWASRASRRRR